MIIVIKTIQFFLCLSLLVLIHELGHFIAARAFRMRVDKFNIFFDPWFAILKFRRRETQYSIGWLPIGGYVKLNEDTFSARPAWQRLIVMLSGVAMNFVLSLTIICALTQSIGGGIRATGRMISLYWQGLKHLVTPEANVSEELGGLISIGSIFPAAWDWPQFWFITALLSIALGIMNLLPIPGLDGGQSLFALYEVITRRKPSPNFVAVATYVGFVFIIGLMIVANGNDIYRLFT